MKSHDASCFSDVLLKIATFAPNWTVFCFVGSACGRFAMLHFAPVLSAMSLRKGIEEVGEKEKRRFPPGRSFCQSKPAGVYPLPSLFIRSYICRTCRPCAPFHATV